MKQVIFNTALFIFSSIVVFGQSSSDEQNLKRIEQDLTAALIKNDASVFEKFLADAFIFTAPDGTVMNKAENIAPIKSRELKFESSNLDDMKVQLHGNTAVVTYRSTDKGKYKDQDLSGQYRWTDVFSKQGESWQIVATQGTPIAKKAQ